MIDNSLVVLKRGQNIVKNRRGGRLAPTTVNSSVRTREYLATAEIERLMAAARKSSRHASSGSQVRLQFPSPCTTVLMALYVLQIRMMSMTMLGRPL
jgi:hypothetical protein